MPIGTHPEPLNCERLVRGGRLIASLPLPRATRSTADSHAMEHATDHTAAKTVGTPRFGILRILDRIEATTLHTTDGPLPRTSRSIAYYHFNLRDLGLRSEWNPNDPLTWEQLAATKDQLTVRRWRRALTWFLYAVAVVVAIAVLAGFSLGGPWAVAAGVTTILAIVGGIALVANELLFERW